jgi:hypothetical protein
MKLEYFKRTQDGIEIWRSICKYESNGMQKQINVEAHTTFHVDFFEKIIKTNKIYDKERKSVISQTSCII